ncbi:MAG: hypothetical protein WCI27_06865 [Candidatus Omnitrophota bacterium]
MEKNKKQPRKKIEIKKTLKAFLADEDGFVNQETILKIGLATVAGVGAFQSISGAAVCPPGSGPDLNTYYSSLPTYTGHNNSMVFSTVPDPDASTCMIPNATHDNCERTVTHSSY